MKLPSVSPTRRIIFKSQTNDILAIFYMGQQINRALTKLTKNLLSLSGYLKNSKKVIDVRNLQHHRFNIINIPRQFAFQVTNIANAIAIKILLQGIRRHRTIIGLINYAVRIVITIRAVPLAISIRISILGGIKGKTVNFVYIPVVIVIKIAMIQKPIAVEITAQIIINDHAQPYGGILASGLPNHYLKWL